MRGGHLAILRSGFGATKESEMAAGDIVPVSGAQFEETLASASPDLLRAMIREFAQRMMDADVEVACNAGYGEVSPDRVNSRNGTGAGSRIPGRDDAGWPSRSCARGRISRASWSTAAGPSGRWPRWWRRLPAGRLDPAGGEAGRLPRGHRACPSRRSARWRRSWTSWWRAFRTRPLDGGPYTFCWSTR